MGYSGQVNITLTIKDGKITEVTNTNSDTRSFFNKAWRSIQPKILEKQSTEGIDTVSGATFSSMGILDASKIALEQAKNTEVQPSVTPEPTERRIPPRSQNPQIRQSRLLFRNQRLHRSLQLYQSLLKRQRQLLHRNRRIHRRIL